MKQFAQLGALSALNIAISFLYQWYVLAQLGPGGETDALFAGMTLPQVVLAIISGSLMHVLVPILAGESEQNLRRDAWGLLVLIGGLFSFLAVLLYAAAPWWIPLIVPGFDDATVALTIELTRIQLIGMVLSAINGVQWAAYHARQKFVWPEFAPVLAGAFAFLLLIWALPRLGVVAAAWIITLRVALQTLLLVPGMGRPALPSLTAPAIRQAWKRIKPLLMGTAYYKSDPLVDRFLLSTASSGNLSLYYLAQQVFSAAGQVVSRAIAAPVVPMLSMLYKTGDRDGFRRVYRRKLMQVGGISLLGLLILVWMGRPLLVLLLGHGSLSTDDLELLWLVMLFMSGQFAVANLGVIMTSAFYSIGDTNSPTIVGMVSYSAGIVIKIILFNFMGTLGLALAVTIYFLISLALMSKKISETKYV